ncbi:substrate-binding domain-containing protein [Microbacterium sp. NPDC077184]|uniref:sugar ABC transporter substrate-binding protein n=1 Tax=Microbacterium sp. NPDC077184 TaxID=3154764 RepID=UPI0034276204
MNPQPPFRRPLIARFRRQWGVMVGGAAVAALVLTGCADTTGPAETDAATAGGVPAAVADAVAAGYEGTSTAPPDSGPAPAADKSVWILSAFQQIQGLARLAERAEEAATALGWSSDICDGQNNVGGGWAACVRQAVAAGADAIVLMSIDCAPVKAPLQEARDAGVAIVSLTSFDCDDPTQGGSEPLFDVTIGYLDDVADPQTFFESMGRLRADWIIAQTGGEAKVLQVKFDGVAFGAYLAKGFEEQLATCSGCEIVSTLALTPADVPNIRQKFETALLQASDADAVSVDVDFMFTAGIQPALVAAGRDLVVAGGECGDANLDYIRAGGGQQMCIGNSLGHMSYAAMDELNRYFAGEEPAVEGMGWQLVDADNNLPPAGEEFDGPIDYVSAYTSIWK